MDELDALNDELDALVERLTTMSTRPVSQPGMVDPRNQDAGRVKLIKEFITMINDAREAAAPEEEEESSSSGSSSSA